MVSFTAPGSTEGELVMRRDSVSTRAGHSSHRLVRGGGQRRWQDEVSDAAIMAAEARHH
jgi:hypothetical protein